MTPSTTTRRALALGAAALLALTAAACSSSSGSGSGGQKSMTLILGTKGDEFYQTMSCGAQAEAKKLGVKLDVTGAQQWDAQQQIPIVDSVTAQRPDAVLIAPVDTKALVQPLKQTQQNGSKVVLVDTTVDDASIGVSRISSDNVLGGKVAADALGAQLGGKGAVLTVSVEPGVSTTDQRIQGFQAELKAKYPGIQDLGVQYDNDDPAKAASIVSSELAAHPNMTGVFAANVLAGEGAATGAKNAGRGGQLKIAAFDAGPKQVADLKSGVLQVLVAQDPATIGSDGVQQAYNALTGKPVTAHIGTDLVAITQQNMDQESRYFYKSTC
jgi:ribose transport system substrate-binding protein